MDPPKKADIVFLVDGSINFGRDNFNEVMSFITNLIDLFFTDRDNLRIGLAHYATDVTDEFYLNTYKNREDILDASGKVEYKGGNRINTGEALRHVENVYFKKEKGSRIDQGIPQILVVVNGGRSADDSRTAVLSLKKKGVNIYGVGVGDTRTEIENIASKLSLVSKVKRVQELSELNEQILNALEDVMKDKICIEASEDLKSKKHCVIFLLA